MQKSPTSYKKGYLIAMGTRKNPTDIINRAQSNGFKSGLHHEEDKKTGLQEYDEKTLGAQDQVLEKYAIWAFKYLNNKLVTVFEEFEAMLLCKDASLPEIHHLKDFWRFYKDQARGRLSERPTARSLKASAKSFNGGFKRRTGNSVPAETIAEINLWIGGPLTSEEGSGVTNIERPKYNYKPQDLDRNLKALWSRSDIGVRHERERFQFHFLLLLFCDTGARREGLFKAGIPYKVAQRTVKNNKDPKNRRFGVTGREHRLLRYNAVFLLLHFAIADGALDHDFFTQILNGKGDGSIEWKEAALELPVCRSVDRNGCLTSEAMTFAVFEPAERLQCWERDVKALDHIDRSHGWHWTCLHCNFVSDSKESGRNHLHDAHGYQFRRPKAGLTVPRAIGHKISMDELSTDMNCGQGAESLEMLAGRGDSSPDHAPEEKAEMAELTLHDGFLETNFDVRTSDPYTPPLEWSETSDDVVERLMDECLLLPPTPPSELTGSEQSYPEDYLMINPVDYKAPYYLLSTQLDTNDTKSKGIDHPLETAEMEWVHHSEANCTQLEEQPLYPPEPPKRQQLIIELRSVSTREDYESFENLSSTNDKEQILPQTGKKRFRQKLNSFSSSPGSRPKKAQAVVNNDAAVTPTGQHGAGILREASACREVLWLHLICAVAECFIEFACEQLETDTIILRMRNTQNQSRQLISLNDEKMREEATKVGYGLVTLQGNFITSSINIVPLSIYHRDRCEEALQDGLEI
ncbi:hypothetical protein ACQRIU_006917 [Beauveria bassiana]